MIDNLADYFSWLDRLMVSSLLELRWQTSWPSTWYVPLLASLRSNLPRSDSFSTALQTQTASHSPRKMNDPDLSTKLKLMGVDVASFGDFFADDRMERELTITAQAAAILEEAERTKSGDGVVIQDSKPRRAKRDTRNDPIKCLTYHDPFSGTYKKFIFSQDGKYLVGGIMIGDTGAFTKLVAIVKKKVSFFLFLSDSF